VSRKVDLHAEVNSPPKCKNISGMVEHLSKWEEVIDEFYLMGGAQIPEKEMVVIALKQMPSDTPPHVTMSLHDCTFYEGEGGFKEKIEKQVDFLTEFKDSHNMKIHLVDTHRDIAPGPEDDEARDDDQTGDAVDLTEYPEDSQHAILAVMKQQGFRGKFRTGPQRKGSAGSSPDAAPHGCQRAATAEMRKLRGRAWYTRVPEANSPT
jgi:hypothetical protein